MVGDLQPIIEQIKIAIIINNFLRIRFFFFNFLEIEIGDRPNIILKNLLTCKRTNKKWNNWPGLKDRRPYRLVAMQFQTAKIGRLLNTPDKE